MIVYVESNFVLEMALKQKYMFETEAILQLAENRKIELVIPSFALSEPFATITRRYRDMERLSKFIEGMHDQLPGTLRFLADKEAALLWSVISRLVAAGTTIEMSTNCLSYAQQAQKDIGLSQQDSIIYAAIVLDLQNRLHTEPKCFVDSNFRDFKNPAIITELNSYYCYYESNFAKGLNYIQGFVK